MVYAFLHSFPSSLPTLRRVGRGFLHRKLRGCIGDKLAPCVCRRRTDQECFRACAGGGNCFCISIEKEKATIGGNLMRTNGASRKYGWKVVAITCLAVRVGAT